MFFKYYWHYFIVGLITYILTRIIYVYIFKKVDKNKEGYQSKKLNKLDFTISNDDKDDGNDNDVDEESQCTPALPIDTPHIPLNFQKLTKETSLHKSKKFYNLLNKRRTVRHFSTEPIPEEVIKYLIKTAGTAPSGAHTEPWTYVTVTSMEIKQKIRAIIEEEEEINYKKRMGKVWTTDLKPLKTNWIKEYLTDAPCLILIFKQMYSFRNDGKKKLHYYNEQSVNLAAGILITAIHYAGLVSLTSTPLNCGPALRSLLRRPTSEKLTLLLPVGYPAENCKVPDLSRKPLEDILIQF